MQDPFSINLDLQVPTAHVSVGLHFTTCTGLLDGRESLSWLEKQRKLVGWTFTCSPELLASLDFERLICNKPFSRPPENVRFVYNSHVKCYISGSKNEAIIGSFNLTAPTIQDCCVLLSDKKTLTHLRREFERHWEHLL